MVFLRYMIFAPLNATFTLQCFVTGMKILKYCICKKNVKCIYELACALIRI